MEDKYYNKVRDLVIDTETTIKVKDFSKNKKILENNYEIGKILVEAQGGKERNKYGNKIIKEYANSLTKELGKGYSWRNLYNMRAFYLLFSSNEILQPLAAKLSWTHYTILFSLDDVNEVKYYIDSCIKNNLTKRQLHQRIKENEYKNLPLETKTKLINNESLELTELVKNPIIIPNPDNKEIVKEKLLQKLIMENIYSFLKQLGSNYTFVGNEYPVKIGNRYYKIDLLLYNIEYNSYVVVELKIGEIKKEHVGQIELYMNYIDKDIKRITDNKTIGIILCKKDNKLIMRYRSDERIISREYVFNN